MSAEQRSREHFDRMTHAEKAEAIRRLAADRFGDYEIAAATKLSVEMIRAILGQRTST
jgi:hypothetical protein